MGWRATGGDRRSEAAKDQACNASLKYGTAAHWLACLDRDGFGDLGTVIQGYVALAQCYVTLACLELSQPRFDIVQPQPFGGTRAQVLFDLLRSCRTAFGAQETRQTAKQAVSARDRAFWLALAANWEKLAKEAEAPKIRPWAT